MTAIEEDSAAAAAPQPGPAQAGVTHLGVGAREAREAAALREIGTDTSTTSRVRALWRAVTVRGRVAVLVAAGAGLLGWLTGWREWTVVAVTAALLVIAALATALGRSSCAAAVDLPQHRFVVGEPGAVTIQLRNTSTRRMLPLRVEVEIAGESVAVRVPWLGGGRTHRVQIPLPTARRAVVPIGPLRAVRGDVFGLIRRVVQWPLSEHVYVHPRTVRPSRGLPGFVRDLEGVESTLRAASDLSFHALREYVPGDDRRFIHWKSTARNQTLQVREFLQTHRSLVVVVLTGGPADYASDDEFELAVSCAASVVAELVRHRRDVETIGAGAEIRGVTADGVLDQFSAVDLEPAGHGLVFETRRAVRRHPRASLVMLAFGSTVSASAIRTALRACPAGTGVLPIRVRDAASGEPARVAGSDGVVTVSDLDELPLALRRAGGVQ